MTHDTHPSTDAHSPATAFQDDRMAAILEAESELGSGLTDQVVARCTDLLKQNHTKVRRLVDLGCGPGVATTQLAEAFEQAAVIGVDGSPAMLERAADRAGGHGVSSRVELRSLDLNGDLRALGKFDLVWAALALHHTADEQDALDNFAALLRPQGLLCLIERADPIVVRPANELGQPGIWERVEAAQSEWFERTRGSLPGVVDVQSYVGMIEQAGLALLDTRTLTDTVTSTDERLLQPTIHRCVRAALRDLRDHLGPADVEALIDAEARVAEIAWGDALVTSTRTQFIAQRRGSRT